MVWDAWMQRFLASVLNYIPGFRRPRLEGVLAEFARAESEAGSPSERYFAVDRLLSKVLSFDRIAIRYINQSHATFTDVFVTGHSVNAWGLHATRPLAGTVTESVVKTGQPALIADCAAIEFTDLYPNLQVSAALLRSMLCVPMINDGKVVGAVILRAGKPDAFTDRELKVLEAVTLHMTPVLVNSSDWLAAARESHESAVLAEIERFTSTAVEFSEVWDRLVANAKRLITFDRIVLAMVEENGITITDRFVSGVPLANWDEIPQRPKSTVPAAGIINSRRARIMSMKENDDAHLDLMGYVMSERVGLKSAMFAPLVAGDRVIGTISVRSLEENAYSEEDRLLFERLAVQIGGPVATSELYSRSLRLTSSIESRIRLELENTKLEEMNQAKARFISMVSHELRTPLTSIIAFADIIGRNQNNTLSERDLSQLAVVKRNGSRLRLLIEDLLAMSEIESGDISIARMEFSLEESVSQLSDSIAPILSAKNQKLVAEFSARNISLVSDRIRIEQILSNLVSNASKYSDDDSEIKIKVSREYDTVKIVVIDSGEGMDEYELPSLFDEFSRLDNDVTRANQGSGLGLAISRRLATALGGTVEVLSKKGEGSVFTVTLPIELPKAA